MNTSHLTDEEVIASALNYDPVNSIEIASRFEKRLEEMKEAEEKVFEEDAKNWAIGCFTEHAGEDFHQDVIDRLHGALKMNKPEMMQEIRGVIEVLNEFDLRACYEVAAMRQDGMQ